MSRIGLNPARHRLSDYRPARVTVCILVHLPHLTGYFQHRLDVVRLSLRSLLRHTDVPYDLLIFDNGSCPEVKAFLGTLRDEGALAFLITAEQNIGKLGALRIIAGAAPGDLIAYADDDTFFYPGWLPAHLRILDTFPRVGMVSGCPERTLFDHGIQSALTWAQNQADAKLTYGQKIPERWEQDWAVSLGREPEAFLQRIRELQDIQIVWGAETAYATACHNQFVSPKQVLVETLKGDWTGRLMGGLNELDNSVDDAGYMRLTTPLRTTRLIGNLVGPQINEVAQGLGLSTRGPVRPTRGLRRNAWTARVVRWNPVRWFLQGLYNRLFWTLTGQSGRWIEPAPPKGDPDS